MKTWRSTSKIFARPLTAPVVHSKMKNIKGLFGLLGDIANNTEVPRSMIVKPSENRSRVSRSRFGNDQ